MEHTGYSYQIYEHVLTQKLLKGIPHAIVLKDKMTVRCTYWFRPQQNQMYVGAMEMGILLRPRSLSLIETMIHDKQFRM